MLFESICFKFNLDYLIHLNKNRLIPFNIKLSFRDKTEYQYLVFSDLKEAQSFYENHYSLIKEDSFSALVSLESLSLENSLYDNIKSYYLYDIKNDLKITHNVKWDEKRKSITNRELNKQKTFLKASTEDYKNFLKKLEGYFLNDSLVYSLTYAEPGWSKNSIYLDNLLKTRKENAHKFPYE